VGVVDLAARFLPLLGTWTGLEHLQVDGLGGVSARASMALRLDVGGTAVVQDYRQVRADGAELTAHGVFRVVEAEQVAWWLFDSDQDLPALATGRFTEGVLVLEGQGRRHRFHGEGDELEQRVHRRTEAGWQTVLNGRYRRLSGH
jgi:hypothetical protein